MPINMLKMLKAMTISVNTLKMLDAYESNFLYNAYKMPLYFNSAKQIPLANQNKVKLQKFGKTISKIFFHCDKEHPSTT